MARSRPPVPSPSDRDAFLTELLQRNFVFVATVVRTGVLRELGGFEASVSSAEDYQMWLRILLAGYLGVAVPGRHAVYRKHRLQMSRQLATMSDAVGDVYRSLPIEDMPTPAHREQLRQRRAASARAARITRLVAPVLPLRAIERAKRLGLGEAWWSDLPPDVGPEVRALLADGGAGPAASTDGLAWDPAPARPASQERRWRRRG
jgi:hypothetical protein